MIFSVNVLHHLRQPYRAADEFLRLLSPQGRLVLADFTEVGFRIIEKIQAAEGKKHEAGKVRLSELELYLREKGLAVRRTASVIQDVLIGRKKII
jgi:SAM-dependent methyltransferase